MLDERCLNLRSRQPVSRDIDDIVHAASDPVVTFVVTASTISSELRMSALYFMQCSCTHVVALVDVQVCVHVSLVSSPDCARQTWPWLFECQNTLDVVAVYLFTRHGVDDRRLDTKEG
jgi:hypothetical protein